MSVKIRLSRVGRTHVPFYRIVAVDTRKKRDGAYLDVIGSYDALKGKLVQFYPEKYEKWKNVGAIPSDTVKRIFKQFKKSGFALDKPVEITEGIEKKETQKSVEQEVNNETTS